MKHGKKYNDSVKLVDSTKQYDRDEALDLVVKTAKAKFDETVEVHIKLGVDGRHADQQVRGAVVLPNGTGKKVRVLVFCKGDNVQLAKDAGAEYVGDADLVAKIQGEGWMDFDVVIATPDLIPRLVPLRRTWPVRSKRRRLVRSSTVSTRPTSSTAPSARPLLVPRSWARTSTPWWVPFSRRSRRRPRASTSALWWFPPLWAPVSVSTRPSMLAKLC